MIYRISQTLACSRSAAVRILSFSLFHININSGPAGFITYSQATNKLEVFFANFLILVPDCLREMQAVIDEVQAVVHSLPLYIAAAIDIPQTNYLGNISSS